MKYIHNLGKITNTHVYFYGGVFSNWYPCKFTIPASINIPSNKIKVNCAEQAMMYYKAVYFNDIETAMEILDAKHPKAQKKLGRQVKNYNDDMWAKARYDLVVKILKCKFEQNKELRTILMMTGNRTLVEASPYDKIWGVGLGLDDYAIGNEQLWKGQNLLGKALMEVRSSFE